MCSRLRNRALYVVGIVFIVLASMGATLWPPSNFVQADPAPTPVPAPTPAPPPTPTPVPAPTVGIIVPKSAEGEMWWKMGHEWAAKNGLTVVAVQWYVPGNKDDIVRTVKMLLEAKPGHIYIGGAQQWEADFIQQLLKEFGYWGKVIVGLRSPQTIHVNMGWQEKGPVFGPWQPRPMPAVVQLAPASFVMWYSTGSWINWATSSDAVNWSDRGPINVSGAPPAGYQLGIPSVCFWREQVGVVWQEHFLMYVSAYTNVGGVRHYDYVLVLQSIDGVNWSYLGTAFADADPGIDPPGTLLSLEAIRTESGYKGWLQDTIFSPGGWGYTTSADGAAWTTPQATTGLSFPVSRPTVVHLAGKYVMWYGYALNPGDQPATAIGMALSDDGVNWTPSPENPLFKVEPDTWRSESTAMPQVVLDEWNGLWRMWFAGGTSHVQQNTEFLTLDPASPTDSPAPGRFAQGVADPNSIVMQLRHPSSVQPVEGVNSVTDDEGNSYPVASFEPTGNVILGGFDGLNGGTKTAEVETLTVRYNQRIRDFRVGYAEAPTHILHDVVNKASWGDEIVVHPGAYLGQVCGDEAIRLRSSHGPALTLIDARQERRYVTAMGNYPAIWLNAAESGWQGLPDWWIKQYGVPETRIEGFTVANSQGGGVAMHLLPGDKAKLNPSGRVMNNVVRSISGSGIGVASSSSNTRLENNQVYGNSGSGIVVSASAWVGVFNNSVHNNGLEGISLLARSGGWSYSHVEGNQVVDNGEAGIHSTMNDGQFQVNTVTGNGGWAVHLETQGRPSVVGNTVSGNGGDGIHVTQAHIEGNEVQGNSGIGIYAANEAAVWSNDISSSGHHGVVVGNWAEIRNNSISGNSFNGILVNPGAASVLDNDIHDNGGHGVALTGRDGSRVAGNTIASNGSDGIHSDNSYNLISANQVAGNQHGMWLEGDNNQILANTIQNNVSSASGIHLTASAEGNQIHHNNIVGNSSHGVFKEAAPPVDATYNWWGDASGPSGAGPGTGDAVNENVLYDPWLLAAFSDSTPPEVYDSRALPESLAIYGMTPSSTAWTLGPSLTTLLARASDEHSGVVKAEIDLRPLAEMLVADLQIPPEHLTEWQGWLQSLEHYRWMWYDGAIWGHNFDLSWLVNDIAKRFYGWGMGETAQVILFKLHAGESQVPVTVYDGAGNHVTVNIPLTVADLMLPLNEGWNLRSAPIALDDDAWGHVKALGDGLAADVALRFDDSTQQWQVLGDADHWRPLDGIYVHATDPDQLNLIVGRSPTAPPLRDLAAGWALVGPAPGFGVGEMPVTDALRSLEVNAAGERGYLIATSPAQLAAYSQQYRYQLPDGTWRGYGSYDWHFQQNPWTYLSGDVWQGQTMTPGGGNWVLMEHPDTLAGFSSTPLVSGVPAEGAAALKPAQAPASGPPPLPMALLVSAGGNWSTITAKVAGQVVCQVSSPEATLLVQGDMAKDTPVSFYVDGVMADQVVGYESGKVASVALTTGARTADINADHVVNVLDLVAIAAHFNTLVSAGGNPAADLNGDGIINIFDLARVSLYYGASVP